MVGRLMTPIITSLCLILIHLSGCSSFSGNDSEYIVVSDSISVSFEDDRTHQMTLHKGDIVNVDGDYDVESYRVHVGEYHVLVPKTQLLKKNTSSSSGSTGNGQTIQTGPRGGKYYINSNGNKTYIKSKK